MRVIAGKIRGKKLKSPEDQSVRPTLDRVKENLFNMVSPDIRDAVAADLFGGSGALGIEALSRGARICYFSDNHKKSIELIRANLHGTPVEKDAVILFMTAEEAVQKLYNQGVKVDYLFLDPPYSQGIVEKMLKQLEKYNIMQERGRIIIESDRSEENHFESEHFVLVKEKNYSSTKITILEARKRGTDE